jgi:hypothetical protein
VGGHVRSDFEPHVFQRVVPGNLSDIEPRVYEDEVAAISYLATDAFAILSKLNIAGKVVGIIRDFPG